MLNRTLTHPHTHTHRHTLRHTHAHIHVGTGVYQTYTSIISMIKHSRTLRKKKVEEGGEVGEGGGGVELVAFLVSSLRHRRMSARQKGG